MAYIVKEFVTRAHPSVFTECDYILSPALWREYTKEKEPDENQLLAHARKFLGNSNLQWQDTISLTARDCEHQKLRLANINASQELQPHCSPI